MVFYVGKGTRRRFKSQANRNKHWHNIVGKHGFTHEIVARFATHEEAYEHEKFLIWCFRDMGLVLANISDGGKGRTGAGIPHTEEHKKMMSERHAGEGNPFFGKKHSEDAIKKITQHSTGVCRISEEVKKKMSDDRRGVKRPPSVGEKIRAARTGTKASEETKAKMRIAQAKRFLREKQNVSSDF
jgi:group I intron endonuclease